MFKFRVGGPIKCMQTNTIYPVSISMLMLENCVSSVTPTINRTPSMSLKISGGMDFFNEGKKNLDFKWFYSFNSRDWINLDRE